MKATWWLVLAAAAALPAMAGGCSTDASFVEVTTAEQFGRDVLGAREPAVVLYYAQGCTHCMAIYPTLNKLAEKYATSVKFLKVSYNRAATVDIRLDQRIDVYPTVILYFRGKGAKRWVEEGRIEAYEEVLDRAIERAKQP
jgi:thiol-disulfide isomerase/thioredoxin